MTSSLPGGWPTDLNTLAGIAADLARPESDRERAFKELLPMIRRVARRVAMRFAARYEDDLLDEAQGEVWQAIQGYQSGRPFEPWCYGVLRNHLIDRLRKEQRERSRRGTIAVPGEVPGLQDALERLLDEQRPFPPSDLETFRTWPLPQRLALLSLTGLWKKVPHEAWGAWVEEYRSSRDSELPEPFPPKELRESDDIAERDAVLSRAMRIPRNTLSVWLYRYKGRLRDLQYVRGLLDNA